MLGQLALIISYIAIGLYIDYSGTYKTSCYSFGFGAVGIWFVMYRELMV